MNWLITAVEDIAYALSERFQRLLGRDDTASKFARSDSEEWNLLLPK
jgi:hypothetical protein